MGPDVKSDLPVLVYLPHSYTGRGPAESCVRILEWLSDHGIDPTVFVVRATRSIPGRVRTVTGVSGLANRLPYRLVRDWGVRRLSRKFRAAIDAAEPGTIVWFWPDADPQLIDHAKARGLLVVREMINSPLQHAKPILDAAYARIGLTPAHGISDTAIERENAELRLCDGVFASNPEVEKGLRTLGIPEERIMPTTFGWTRGRIDADERREVSDSQVLRFCYVGSLIVRKGVPELLEAWRRAAIDGELVLAGTPEAGLEPLITDYRTRCPSIRLAGFVEDIGDFYRSNDVFVFPTLEEGGPQVTYEAAACGIAIVTTAMGAARLVKDGESGLLVPAGDIDALVDALRRLAGDGRLRRRLAAAAADEASFYEYKAVAQGRARHLHALASRALTE